MSGSHGPEHVRAPPVAILLGKATDQPLHAFRKMLPRPTASKHKTLIFNADYGCWLFYFLFFLSKIEFLCLFLLGKCQKEQGPLALSSGRLWESLTISVATLQEPQTLPPSGSADKPFRGSSVCDSNSFDVPFVLSPGQRLAEEAQRTTGGFNKAESRLEDQTLLMCRFRCERK